MTLKYVHFEHNGVPMSYFPEEDGIDLEPGDCEHLGISYAEALEHGRRLCKASPESVGEIEFTIR